MSLTLKAFSMTMTFDEIVEGDDDLEALARVVFAMGTTDGPIRGHTSITAVDYSDDGHTVTLTLDVGDVVCVDPNDVPPTT